MMNAKRKGANLRNLSLSNRLFKAIFITLLSLLVASCSSNSSGESKEETSKSENPLAELTFAENSSDAYNRSCYWGSEGNNIFMYQRMQEGNELAEQEGKLPILGVEQAMDTVLRKGEPQAKKEYQMVKEFCSKLGFTFKD